ncbi:MAG: hypothetical protein ABFD08_01800 [Syntrophomonas sp.]
MPITGSIGGYKPEKDSLAKAKGKNGMSMANELFAASNDFFHEFGLVPKPKGKSK